MSAGAEGAAAATLDALPRDLPTVLRTRLAAVDRVDLDGVTVGAVADEGPAAQDFWAAATAVTVARATCKTACSLDGVSSSASAMPLAASAPACLTGDGRVPYAVKELEAEGATVETTRTLGAARSFLPGLAATLATPPCRPFDAPVPATIGVAIDDELTKTNTCRKPNQPFHTVPRIDSGTACTVSIQIKQGVSYTPDHARCPLRRGSGERHGGRQRCLKLGRRRR